MKLESKYDFGDRVHHVMRSVEQHWVRCTFCEGSDVRKIIGMGTKIVGLDGEERTCPECHGKGGRKEYADRKAWVPGQVLTIGQVRLKVDRGDRKETYMCVETGVGSGSVYHVEDLFPSEAAALAECDQRNEDD